MKKETNGPARDQAPCEVMPINKNGIKLHKSYAQSQLPDNRQFKGDLLEAVQKALAAHQAYADTLFVLESHLEEALARDDNRGMC